MADSGVFRRALDVHLLPAEAAQGLAREAAQVPQYKTQLDNIEQNLKEFTSGPYAPYFAKFGAAANQISQAVAGKDVIDPGYPAAAESFRKAATNLQQAQARALGGTVAAINNTEHSIPSLEFSPAGNKEIIANLRGMQDAITAKNNAWQSYLAKGGSPQSFNKFENEFNKSFEPRAYMYPYLTPEQKLKVYNDLPSANAKIEFRKRYTEAVAKGYINP